MKQTLTRPFFRCPELAAVLGLAALSFAWGCGNSVARTTANPGDAETSGDVARFLRAHWPRPIPPQGEPPAGWTAAEVDLSPAACGVCHPAQLSDWSGSLHAAAHSPGLAGQLAAGIRMDPATVESCLSCHAPLAEQIANAADSTGAYVANSEYRPALEKAGVLCAGCHVRGWRRFGPPQRDGSLAPPPPGTPHGGAIRTPAFEASAFCASCHQFDSPAPNGKPLENTVREWEVSDFAARGVTCQRCHMPGRRHLWRGIHDPAMTRGGVLPTWTVRGRPDEGGFEVRLALANHGTGHHFPTYVTPAVDLEIAFLDGAGDTVGVRRRTLRREVVYDRGEWVEIRDDRIPAGGRAEVGWRGPAPAGSSAVAGRVRIRPDAFYEKFYRKLLADPAAGYDRASLERALVAARSSAYDLWTWRTALPPGRGGSVAR